MKLTDLPAHVAIDLANWGMTDAVLADLTPTDVFGVWLGWHGIIGYTDAIRDAALAIFPLKKGAVHA